MVAGLELDPNNDGLKKALQEAEAAGKKSPMAGLFGPQFMAKLATNPKTRSYLSQPDFMQMLQVCCCQSCSFTLTEYCRGLIQKYIKETEVLTGWLDGRASGRHTGHNLPLLVPLLVR